MSLSLLIRLIKCFHCWKSYFHLHSDFISIGILLTLFNAPSYSCWTSAIVINSTFCTAGAHTAPKYFCFSHIHGACTYKHPIHCPFHIVRTQFPESDPCFLRHLLVMLGNDMLVITGKRFVMYIDHLKTINAKVYYSLLFSLLPSEYYSVTCSNTTSRPIIFQYLLLARVTHLC